MILNKKGMSLLELLITIFMIGVVMVFLFQLLVDLKSMRDNNNYAYDNQVNRADLLHTVQKDLNRYIFLGIKDNSAGNSLILDFYYRKGSEIKNATLKTMKNGDKHYFHYKAYNGTEYKWEMINAIIDPCGTFSYYTDDITNLIYFKIDIFVYNDIEHKDNKKSNNNKMDDIEITYTYPKNQFFNTTRSNWLTNTTTGTKKIGRC